MKSKLLLLFILVGAISTSALAQGRHSGMGPRMAAGAHVGYGQGMRNGGGMGPMGNRQQIGQAGFDRVSQSQRRNRDNWGRGARTRQNSNSQGSGGTNSHRGKNPRR